MFDLLEVDLSDDEVLDIMATYSKAILHKMFRNGMQLMYELTSKKCELDKCHGICCSPEQCEIVKNDLDAQGVEYNQGTHPTMAFLTDDGCILEPWQRPLCTLHICDKFLMSDELFYSKYFHLRSNLDLLLYILDEDDECLKKQICSWPQPSESSETSSQGVRARIKKLKNS